MSNTEFNQQVLLLLTKLKNKREALQREYEARAADIDREIESVSTTLRLLREPDSAVLSNRTALTGAPFVNDSTLVNQIMGKTAREALILIARANGGIVKIVDAKWMLLSAGIIKNKKHSWGATYTTLMRSAEFEKVPDESGTFRLIENTEQQKLSVAS